MKRKGKRVHLTSERNSNWLALRQVNCEIYCEDAIMLKSKSTLLISLLFATQLASAGSLMVEKQSANPADQVVNGTVMVEHSAQLQRGGGVILERGIIVQDKLASASIVEGEHVPKHGIIVQKNELAGGVIIERGIIVQKNQLAGVVILENTPRPDAGIILHDGKLAGGLIIERGGVILEDLHLNA